MSIRNLNKESKRGFGKGIVNIKIRSNKILCCEKGRGGRAKDDESCLKPSSRISIEEDGGGSERSECLVTALTSGKFKINLNLLNVYLPHLLPIK